ncbi:hypothetical protein, partial [Paraburkholderia aspalathi]|uniref:hypothetical protein n=1 Tax=Paraburkholderia aspalathi TaxID=1324617 RepID=UPI001BA8CFF0
DGVETLFFLPWNRHSLCRGIRVLFPVESLFTLAWNIQSLRRKCPAPLRRKVTGGASWDCVSV